MNTISRMGVGRQICMTAASIFLAVSVIATAAVADYAKKFSDHLRFAARTGQPVHAADD